MREREVAGVENRKGLEALVVRVSNPFLAFKCESQPHSC